MTRNGTAFRRQPLAPLTSATGSGWWPTPTTQDGSNNGGPSQHDRNSLPLNALVQYLPTPTTRVAKGVAGPDFAREDRQGSGGDDLVTYLHRLRRSKPRRRAHSQQLSLDGADPGTDSTTSPDEQPPSGGLLNPCFLSWMLGFPAGWLRAMLSEIPPAR